MKPIIGLDLSKISRIIYIPTKNEQNTYLRPQFIRLLFLYYTHVIIRPTADFC